MPLQIPFQEFETLRRIIAARPNGASIKELMAISALGFPKRTLQRRLDQLVTEKQILPKGEGRARRYLAAEEMDFTFSSAVREDPPVYKIRHDWLSADALEIRSIIQLPLAQRTTVTYQGAFLDAYRPNKVFYLPENLRKKLGEIGQVGMSDLPAGTYLRQVMDRLIIDLSWNSSRLEGNTYSLLETQRLLEFGEDTEGKGTQETQMILNHKAAIEMLADDAGELDFNNYTICNLHALLSDNLLSDQGACGRLRSCRVGISGTVFRPLSTPQQIEERFEQILQKASAIIDPFEQAFFTMVHMPYLQPFEDVNKRVSRLAANIPLVRHNLCPLSFVDVASADYIGGLIGVYELNRIEYLRDVFAMAYRRSCARYSTVRRTLGDPDPFRLQHRGAIASFVREVVFGGMDKRVAAKWISENAAGTISQIERAKFIEVVETELGCLHAGNIARYRLRPSEFETWRQGWR